MLILFNSVFFFFIRLSSFEYCFLYFWYSSATVDGLLPTTTVFVRFRKAIAFFHFYDCDFCILDESFIDTDNGVLVRALRSARVCVCLWLYVARVYLLFIWCTTVYAIVEYMLFSFR